ncbi:MAG: hypothetical protein ACR2LH_00100 [Thermoleophilaceae bacterium]
MTHRTLSRRRWWDARFAEVGFEPGPLPGAPLPYVEPYAYLRRA